MTAIPVVSSKENFPNPVAYVPGPTVEKVEKIWLNWLSGLALAGAAAAGILAWVWQEPSPVSVAIPLCATAAALFFKSRSLIDYSDPATRMEILAETARLPLEKVVEKHGWVNLFRYRLLDQDQFAKAYRDHVHALSFQEIISFYRQALRSLSDAIALGAESRPIPAPSEFKQIFENETKHMSCLQIAESYTMDDLREFQIVPSAKLQILEQALLEDQFRRIKISDLEKELRNAVFRQEQILQDARTAADAVFLAHPAHRELRRIEEARVQDEANLRNEIAESIRQEKDLFECFKCNLEANRCNIRENNLNELALRERLMRYGISRLLSDERRGIMEIRREADYKRNIAEQPLVAARDQRDRAVEAAGAEYQKAGRTEQKRIDALQAQVLARFRSQIAALDRAYRS